MKRLLLLLTLTICINTTVSAQTIRYVAPNTVGLGDGLSSASAKDFLDSSFWTEIQNLLQTQSVTVKFIAGDYVRAYTEQSLILNGTGHIKNKLTLEGETGNTTVFTAPTGHGNKTLMVSLVNCQNVTVKNFYFTGNGSIEYVFRVTSSSGKVAKNILVENCHWEDMRGIIYGASGTAHPGTSYVTFRNCFFKNIGLNSGSHMIYNAYDAHHISVIDSHFEDCTGDYVRFRDNLDYAVVKGSAFIRSAGFVDFPFIAMPLFNNVNPGDEIFATNYSFTDNTFTNAAIAIQFYSSGFDPVGRNYLLTAQEGSHLTSGTTQQKKDVLLNNFKINTDLVRINNNTYNSITKQVVIRSITAYGSVSKGWTGEATISNLFNNSNDLLPWEENYYNLPRWTESGSLKNIAWNYSFAGGTGTVTNSSSGITKASTPTVQDFLPKPPSGEVKVTAYTTERPGASSFTLNGACGTACLTMVHTSGNGTSASPTKFVARNFEGQSKVMSAHFKITPSNTVGNYQAIWYIPVGSATAGAINTPSSAPIISASGTTADNLYTVLRIRKVAAGNTYGIQARYNDGTQARFVDNYWGWESISGATLTNGTEAKIDLFFNNTDIQQEYTFNGVKKQLAAASYHIYIDDVQKGATLTNLVRNTYPANSAIQYTGDLSGISIMSREGAHSNVKDPTDPENKRFIYDNSASLTISEFKIVHLATPVTTPVTLTNFEGTKTNTGIALNWQTVSEQNNSHFVLSRSSNGHNFAEIAKIKGNGTTSNISNYSFTDHYPVNGNNYYRLEQADLDNKINKIDKIVRVNYIVSQDAFTVYKQSANSLKIMISSVRTEPSDIILTDITGKTIYKTKRILKEGMNDLELAIPNVKQAVSVVHVKTASASKSVKLIL